MYFCSQNNTKNMTTTVRKVTTLAGLDAVLLAAACLIPAASHVLAFPLYMLNPMLALLLVGILMGRDWRNALALAVLMPLVSSLVVGMPAAPKMVCMMAELAVVAGVFSLLARRWSALPAVLVAVLGGKLVYYALKVLILAPATLVGTEWWIQLGAVLVWGGLFAIIYNRKK